MPSAPRMSPTCASSSTAERAAPVASISTAVTGNSPLSRFHSSGIKAHAHAAKDRRRLSGEISRFIGISRQHRRLTEAPSSGRAIERESCSSCVSVCLGQAGTAAGRADFGPDYQSPWRASLRPRRLCTPSHTTPASAKRNRPLRRQDYCQPGEEVTSLVRALALHGVAMLRSHLASPLRPGRGVLTRSVSRRLGSVACVREDASPNEVSRPWSTQGCPFRFPNVKPELRNPGPARTAAIPCRREQNGRTISSHQATNCSRPLPCPTTCLVTEEPQCPPHRPHQHRSPTQHRSPPHPQRTRTRANRPSAPVTSGSPCRTPRSAY